MNVKQIVEKYLVEHGHDGLFNADGECGCGVGDLEPCSQGSLRCQPAYLHPLEEVFVPVSEVLFEGKVESDWFDYPESLPCVLKDHFVTSGTGLVHKETGNLLPLYRDFVLFKDGVVKK